MVDRKKLKVGDWFKKKLNGNEGCSYYNVIEIIRKGKGRLKEVIIVELRVFFSSERVKEVGFLRYNITRNDMWNAEPLVYLDHRDLIKAIFSSDYMDYDFAYFVNLIKRN